MHLFSRMSTSADEITEAILNACGPPFWQKCSDVRQRSMLVVITTGFRAMTKMAQACKAVNDRTKNGTLSNCRALLDKCSVQVELWSYMAAAFGSTIKVKNVHRQRKCIQFCRGGIVIRL